MEVVNGVNQEEKLRKAILKKALGYDAEEVVEEYATVDEEVKLSKRKVTKKHYPPDLSAIKLIMESIDDPILKTYQGMSKRELLQEKKKLLELLEKENGNQKNKD